MIRLSVVVICVAMVVVWDHCLADDKMDIDDMEAMKARLETARMAGSDGKGVQDKNGHRFRRSLISLGSLCRCRWDLSTWATLTRISDLQGHGCYCGKGNEPGANHVDSIDECCKHHDACWVQADRDFSVRRSFFGWSWVDRCSGHWDGYAFDSTCSCNSGQSGCAKALCDCDVVFADCIAENIDNFSYNSECTSK